MLSYHKTGPEGPELKGWLVDKEYKETLTSVEEKILITTASVQAEFHAPRNQNYSGSLYSLELLDTTESI